MSSICVRHSLYNLSRCQTSSAFVCNRNTACLITCSLPKLTQLNIFQCPHDDRRRDYSMNRFIFNLFPQKVLHPSSYSSGNCKIDQISLETLFCHSFHENSSLVF